MLIALPQSGWLPGACCVAQPITGLVPTLTPEEARLVVHAAPRRQEHFAAGRACAHEALRQLGRPASSLLRTADGAAAWPEGSIGSIAHCDGMAVAIASAGSRWQALGIDVEPAQPLPLDVASYALTTAERAGLASPADADADVAALIAFSAKECVHKCVHPLRGAFLEFDEVEIDVAAGVFTPRPISAAARTALAGLRCEGRWRRAGGFVWTLLALA